jgi:hypothetical protein
MRGEDLVGFEGSDEPPALVRHDEIPVSAGVLAAVGLFAHMVSHNQLARASDHVGEVGLVPRDEFVRGHHAAGAHLGLRVR